MVSVKIIVVNLKAYVNVNLNYKCNSFVRGGAQVNERHAQSQSDYRTEARGSSEN